MRIISLLLIFLISFPIASAQTIPKIVPYVNDLAGVLTQSDINSINLLAAGIEKNTTAQIAVLIVDTTAPSTIDEYANKAFRENGIGNKDNNNGLLIVVATSDRAWRIEVGYGLEGLINDAKAGGIARTYLIPNLKNGDYYIGLHSTVSVIGDIIQGSGDTSIISNQDSFSDFYDIFLVIVIFSTFLLPFIILIFKFTSEELVRCPKCGSRVSEEFVNGRYVYICKNGHKTKRKKVGRYFLYYGGVGRRWGGGSGRGFGGG